MREIKFRYTVVRENGFVFHGDFDFSKHSEWIVKEWVELNKINYKDIFKRQYTGKTDLNEIEIFKGDLIQNESGRICEVYFNEIVGCWDAKVIELTNGDNSNGFEYCDWGSTTIIGNIYEESS